MKVEKSILDPDCIPALKYLIKHLDRHKSPIYIDAVVNDTIAITPYNKRSVNAAIEFLCDCMIISKISSGELILRDKIFTVSSSEIRHALITKHILEHLNTNGLLVRMSHAIKNGVSDNQLVIDHMLIPWKLRAYRDLLLWLGVFYRESIFLRHWEVRNEYHDLFLYAVKIRNKEKYHIKKMSINELKKKLEQNARYGLEAEEWVLGYERKLLKDHPFVNLIDRISENNVQAGFDIVSFENEQSMMHDRFIEVKSYSNYPHFHWSQNEIKRAEELGEQYILILVDRESLSIPNYQPLIIKGPYSYFFKHQSKWESMIESYYFQLKK